MTHQKVELVEVTVHQAQLCQASHHAHALLVDLPWIAQLAYLMITPHRQAVLRCLIDHNDNDMCLPKLGTLTPAMAIGCGHIPMLLPCHKSAAVTPTNQTCKVENAVTKYVSMTYAELQLMVLNKSATGENHGKQAEQ